MLALLADVAPATTTISLDPFIVALIGGTLIPILTGIVTKLEAGNGIKSVVALVLSVAVGALSAIVNGGGTFDWKLLVAAAAAAFAMNVTSYLGLHTTIGSDQPWLSKATANFGLGSAPPQL